MESLLRKEIEFFLLMFSFDEGFYLIFVDFKEFRMEITIFTAMFIFLVSKSV